MIYIDICKIHIRSLYLSEKLSQISSYRYLIIIDYARRVFTYSASLSHLQLAKKSSWNFSPATAPLTRSWSRFFKISIRLSLKATFLTSSRIFLFRNNSFLRIATTWFAFKKFFKNICKI